MEPIPFLRIAAGHAPRAALFLSGSGSNAERLLAAAERAGAAAACRIVVLVTDAPATSRALELGQRFGVPVVANDIRAFYRAGGETRVNLATPLGRDLRQRWTDALRAALAEHRPDFGVLAGFVPLTNLTGDFPCLNVHPGDLTVLRDGARHLVGLHTVPIERALLAGLDHLRSSVILALPYTGRGEDMDNGPLLALSPPVPVELGGATLAELRDVAARRPAQRPSGGFGDALEAVARANQERLKQGGDWLVLPPAVAAFARGAYAHDGAGGLCFRAEDGGWREVETVEFDGAGAARPRLRRG
jgi:folate-dependent phosphoribosylglycinamide formyltransferase PurN